MTVIQYKRDVSVIRDREDVELALQELKKAGFSLSKIYVIARRNSEELNNIDRTSIHQHLNNKSKIGSATGAIILYAEDNDCPQQL